MTCWARLIHRQCMVEQGHPMGAVAPEGLVAVERLPGEARLLRSSLRQHRPSQREAWVARVLPKRRKLSSMRLHKEPWTWGGWKTPTAREVGVE
jgi:hypothetical protein